MNFFDTLPLWAIFLVTAAIVASGFEAGFRTGRLEKSKDKEEPSPPVGAMVGVVLSLTAFILAFTFGVAAERFNDRRLLVIEEANAVGTTYLRSEFLPEPNRQEVQNLLRQYVGVRVNLWHELAQAPDSIDVALVESSVAQSEKVQDSLWKQAVAVGKDRLDSDVIALFIDSLNETIDLQSKRVTAALHARLPSLVWMILYLLVIFGMFGLGYQFGVTGKRKLPITCTVVLAFAIVIMMIADLDNPLAGYLQASKQPLRDLAKKIGVQQQVKDLQ